MIRQPDQVAKEWVYQDGEQTEQGDRSNGEACLLIIRLDHRSGCGDSRISADRSSDADQGSQTRRNVEYSPGNIGQQKGHANTYRNQHQGGHSGRHYVLEAQAQAEQDDPNGAPG